jgi:hypothetical protein
VALADVLVEAGEPAEARRALASAVAAIPDPGRLTSASASCTCRRCFYRAVRLEAAAPQSAIGLDRLCRSARWRTKPGRLRQRCRRLRRESTSARTTPTRKSLVYALKAGDEALAEFAATLLIDPKAWALVGASQVFLRLRAIRGRRSTSRRRRSRSVTAEGRPVRSPCRSCGSDGEVEGRREARLERMQAEVMAATTRQSELNTIRRDAAQRPNDNDYAAAAASSARPSRSTPRPRACIATWACSSESAVRRAVAALNEAIQLEDTAGRIHCSLTRKAMGRGCCDAQAVLAARYRPREGGTPAEAEQGR